MLSFLSLRPNLFWNVRVMWFFFFSPELDLDDNTGFDADTFIQYLQPILTSLFKLLKVREEGDIKDIVLSVLTTLIEQLNDKV